MKTPRRTRWENFIRGGDVLLHQTGMFLKNALWSLALPFALFVVCWGTVFYATTSLPERSIFLYNRWAAATTILPIGFAWPKALRIETEDGRVIERFGLSPSEAISETNDYYESRVRWKVWLATLIGLSAATPLAWVIVRRQERYGDKLGRDEHLRGAQLVTGEELADLVRAKEKPSPFSIGGVSIPERLLMRNIMVTGAMGVGKSQVIFSLLTTARTHGLRGIVYDKTGEFTAHFYRPGRDFILNPLDVRCVPWSVFGEFRNDYDYYQLASYLVPEIKNDHQPIFRNNACLLLSDIFRILDTDPAMTPTMREAHRIATQMPLRQLWELLRDHGASSTGAMNPESAKTAENFRSHLTEAIKFFPYMPDTSSGDRFSVRDWVRRDDDSWLFLTSRSDMHEVMKPYISFWLQLAIMEITTLSAVSEPRMMLFVDELYSLAKMTALNVAMTEGRKYGLITGLGFQGVPQLVEVWGKEGASNLINGAQTKLFLRVEDDETAKRCADILGRAEIEESSEGQSYGLDPDRDGSNVSRRRQERHIVLSSELIYLKDLEGYLKIAGDYPAARITIQPKPYDAHHPGFVQRDGLVIDRENLASPAPAAARTEPIATTDGGNEAGFDFL